METDKVNVEVPAPSNGVLGSIAVKEGETVNVGSLLGTISDKLSQDSNKAPKEIKIIVLQRKSHQNNQPLRKLLKKILMNQF